MWSALISLWARAHLPLPPAVLGVFLGRREGLSPTGKRRDKGGNIGYGDRETIWVSRIESQQSWTKKERRKHLNYLKLLVTMSCWALTGSLAFISELDAEGLERLAALCWVGKSGRAGPSDEHGLWSCRNYFNSSLWQGPRGWPESYFSHCVWIMEMKWDGEY